MNTLQQIEAQAEEVATTAKALAKQCREANFGESSPPWRTAASGASCEAERLRSNMLATLARLQTMLVGPTDFIQHLAHQTQLLACLRWLGEFQILACIPLHGDMAIKDLADLVNVPEAQLRRVVRLMATAEFLEEPQPGSGRVAHTPLSASFVTDCSNLDAAMFLSGTAVPAALQMPEATQSQLSGFLLSSPTGRLPFGTACEQQPKLRREWAAYCGCMRDSTQAVVHLLDRLDWASLGKARIVDVDAESTQVAEGLAERNGDLRWVVQMADGSVAAETSLATSDGGRGRLHTRLDVQIRTPHTPQTLEDAAVYMLRGAEPDCESLASWAQAGLESHLAVLRGNPSAMLLLAVQLGPDPGSVSGAVEAVACARHMTIVQLTGGSREMDLAGLEELVGCVRDSRGGLVVVNRLRSRHCSTIALGIKYMAKPQPLAMVDPSLIWAITSP